MILETLLKKALFAVQDNSFGALTTEEFSKVSSSKRFIDALHRCEEQRQKLLYKTEVETLFINISVINQVNQRRLTDKYLQREYYLRSVKQPEKLTDDDCFELDPKGDPVLMRKMFRVLWDTSKA